MLLMMYLGGGWICGLLLLIPVFSGKRSVAWILPFAFGILLFGLSILITVVAQAASRSDALFFSSLADDCGYVSPLLWWVSAGIYFWKGYLGQDVNGSKYQVRKIVMPLPPENSGSDEG